MVAVTMRDIPGIPPFLRKMYPFQSWFHQLAAGRMHYVDEGEGEAVVCLHGNPTWSFAWRKLILGLRDRVRMIAPDHIGCGLSDRPTGFHYRLEEHIAHIESLIRTLGLRRFHLAVHDWGGAIGMGVATRMPDRVLSMLIMNTAAFQSTDIPLRIRMCRTPILGSLAVRGFNVFARAATHMTTVQPIPPDVRRGYLYPYRSWNSRAGIWGFLRDIPDGPGHPTWETLGRIEQQLHLLRDKPVKIVWGERDWCFHTGFRQKWEQCFPNAVSVVLENAGHYLFEDASDRLVREAEGLFTKTT